VTATWVQDLGGYLHLLAVAVYVGGSVAMEFVLGPAQRFVPPAQAQVIGQRTADRFLALVWGALALFPISGTLLFFSMADEDKLRGTRFFTTHYGQTLLGMIVLWAVLVANGAIITFVLRPRLAQRASARGGGAGVAQRLDTMQAAATWVSRITRIDLVIALFIVLLGISFTYGSGLL
jgi:putative copper export protein